MRSYDFGNAEFFATLDAFKDFRYEGKDAKDFMEDLLEDIFANRVEFKQYMDLYGRLNNLDRYAVIACHGETNGKEWIYSDGRKILRMQNLIDSLDGKFSALILNSCNPGHHTPSSKKSLLIIPTGNVSTCSLDQGFVNFDLIDPKKGRKDVTMYTIDHEIHQMQKKLERLSLKSVGDRL